MRIIALKHYPPAPHETVERMSLVVEDERIPATPTGFRREWWVGDFSSNGGDFEASSLASILRQFADLVEKVGQKEAA